jgi:enterochelin esterase family protein
MWDSDSVRRQGVPEGRVEQRSWSTSRIYPNTTRDYWVYVPAQYVDTEPACLMVFQDGGAYVDPKGQVRATTVFDNLIHSGEMPVTIGVFVSPGMIQEESNRFVEYVAPGDVYSDFLLDEILPELTKDFNLVDDREGRAICGMRDGGLCAFAVAWQKTDVFSKVICHIASFARHVEGANFPHLVRQTRDDPKPLRVFLADGENDLNIDEGNWTLGNLNLASALQFAKYDHRFELAPGGHDLALAGELFPETLRWIWRDFPGVGTAPPAYDEVAGEWNMEVNFYGNKYSSVLTVNVEDDALSATLRDENDGELEITGISFDGGMLKYDYVPSPAQANWGKGVISSMLALLRVNGSTMNGTLSGRSNGETSYDYALIGVRK